MASRTRALGRARVPSFNVFFSGAHAADEEEAHISLGRARGFVDICGDGNTYLVYS
jgi:hypothetical protein